MQKRKKGRKLSRKRDQRKALLRSLARSIILAGKIKTTEAKAKEVAGFVEKQISRAKTDSLHTRRLLLRFFSQETTQKLISEIAPRYKTRKGGYTRIIKLGRKSANGAKMAIIELVK